MRFPDNAFLDFLYWVINTPGLGGIAVAILAVSIITMVTITLRWIVKGGEVEEEEEYVYPTSSLVGHD
jgi:hypothetical protein